MRLTKDEEETLELLADTEHWPVIEKVLAIGVEKHQDALLSLQASDAAGLSLAKAKLDGARAQASLIEGIKRKKKTGAIPLKGEIKNAKRFTIP